MLQSFIITVLYELKIGIDEISLRRKNDRKMIFFFFFPAEISLTSLTNISSFSFKTVIERI